jgi:hypothetical protein
MKYVCKVIFLTIVLTVSYSVKGQDFSMDVMLADFPADSVYGETKWFIGTMDDAHYFMTKLEPEKKKTSIIYQIEKVNDQYVVEDFHRIQLSSDNLQVYPVGSFERNGVIYMLTLEGEPQKYLTKLIARKFEFKNFYKSEPIVIGEVNYPIFPTALEGSRFPRLDGRQYFWIKELHDSSGFAVVYDMLGGKNQKERFGIQFFDNQFVKGENLEIELMVSERQFEILDIQLAPSKELFILGKQYLKGRSEQLRQEVNYVIRLLHFEKGTTEPLHEVEVGLDKIKIKDFKIAIQDETVLGVGMFKSDNLGAGVITFLYDLSLGKITESNLEPFPEALLNVGFESGKKNFMVKWVRNEQNRFLGLRIDQILQAPDGDFLVVAEDRYSTFIQASYEYSANSVIIVKVSSTGAVRWMRKIPKLQFGSEYNSSLIGYNLINTGNHLIFLYNEGKIGAYPVKNYGDFFFYQYNAPFTRGAKTVMAVMDFDGNLDKYHLIDPSIGATAINCQILGKSKEGFLICIRQPKKGKTYGFIKLN